MQSPIFVDTSAFVARFIEADQYHDAAVREAKRLVKAGRAFVTSNYIFDETITMVQNRVNHARGRQVGEFIRTDARLMRVLVDESVEDEAWDLHAKFSDQPLSFTDVTTVVLMRAAGITEIFSFDSDFDRVGLVRLPRPR